MKGKERKHVEIGTVDNNPSASCQSDFVEAFDGFGNAASICHGVNIHQLRKRQSANTFCPTGQYITRFVRSLEIEPNILPH